MEEGIIEGFQFLLSTWAYITFIMWKKIKKKMTILEKKWLIKTWPTLQN